MLRLSSRSQIVLSCYRILDWLLWFLVLFFDLALYQENFLLGNLVVLNLLQVLLYQLDLYLLALFVATYYQQDLTLAQFRSNQVHLFSSLVGQSLYLNNFLRMDFYYILVRLLSLNHPRIVILVLVIVWQFL